MGYKRWVRRRKNNLRMKVKIMLMSFHFEEFEFLHIL